MNGKLNIQSEIFYYCFCFNLTKMLKVDEDVKMYVDQYKDDHDKEHSNFYFYLRFSFV